MVGAYYLYAPDGATVQALDDGAIHGWIRVGRQMPIVDAGRRCGYFRFFQYDVNGAPAYRIKEYRVWLSMSLNFRFAFYLIRVYFLIFFNFYLFIFSFCFLF